MRRRRWIVYEVVFGFAGATPVKLCICGTLAQRKAARECLHGLIDLGDPVYMTYVPARRRAGQKLQVNFADRAIRNKFGSG